MAVPGRILVRMGLGSIYNPSRLGPFHPYLILVRSTRIIVGRCGITRPPFRDWREQQAKKMSCKEVFCLLVGFWLGGPGEYFAFFNLGRLSRWSFVGQVFSKSNRTKFAFNVTLVIDSARFK